MANSTALAKAGEIAIVRANQAKITKEYEYKMKATEKFHADEAARQKLQIESARAELENITTENKFLKQDLNEEGEQTRILRRNLKNAGAGVGGNTIPSKEAANAGPQTTPKKHKALPFRDGFDDDEIMVISPSKVAPKAKRGTPKVGDKRKRKVNDDSPGQPLQLSQSRGENIVEDVEQPRVQEENAVLEKISRQDDRFPVSLLLVQLKPKLNKASLYKAYSITESVKVKIGHSRVLLHWPFLPRLKDISHQYF